MAGTTCRAVLTGRALRFDLAWPLRPGQSMCTGALPLRPHELPQERPHELPHAPFAIALAYGPHGSASEPAPSTTWPLTCVTLTGMVVDCSWVSTAAAMSDALGPVLPLVLIPCACTGTV